MGGIRPLPTIYPPGPAPHTSKPRKFLRTDRRRSAAGWMCVSIRALTRSRGRRDPSCQVLRAAVRGGRRSQVNQRALRILCLLLLLEPRRPTWRQVTYNRSGWRQWITARRLTTAGR